MANEKTLKEELTYLFNCRREENLSGTPDYLLADYVIACLDAYHRSVNSRDQYYIDYYPQNDMS